MTTLAPDPIDEAREVERARVQRRTLRLLFCTQVAAGVGTTIGISFGSLLVRHMGSTDLSGLAQSASVIGGALLAVPVSRLMRARGRRPGLVSAYLCGATGAALVILAAAAAQVWLVMVGMLLFGGGTTANLQARYSAVDLSPAARRARQMSIIVWATTIGGVAAPNLADPADHLATRLGAPALTGPFFVSITVFLAAALVIGLFLRPDPLLYARTLDGSDPAARPGGSGMRAALRVVAASPTARLAIGAVATGHLVMVGVMSMTPVHMDMVMGDADTVRLVGIVISVHVAGMYALSPVVGAAVDRFGRRQVILGGIGILVAACAVAGTSGASTLQLGAGLMLIGLGWSCMIVAGSTLLTESVPADVRPAAQGLSDLLMGCAGALAGAISGVIVSGPGYPTLTLIAALATVPLLGLALRTAGGRPTRPAEATAA